MAKRDLDDALNNVLEGTDEGQSLDTSVAEEDKTRAVDKLREDKAFKESSAKDRKVHKKLMQDNKVKVAISPMYAPYFGDVMVVKLNGFPIYVPVNGRTYEVPEAYAGFIYARIRGVDDMLNRGANMADIQNNKEDTPGELPIF